MIIRTVSVPVESGRHCAVMDIVHGNGGLKVGIPGVDIDIVH